VGNALNQTLLLSQVNVPTHQNIHRVLHITAKIVNCQPTRMSTVFCKLQQKSLTANPPECPPSSAHYSKNC
jgi:hypothetical protein